MKNHSYTLKNLKASARAEYEYKFGIRELDKEFLEWAIADAIKHGHPSHFQSGKSKKLFKEALAFASRKWAPAKMVPYAQYVGSGVEYYIPTETNGLFELVSVSFYKSFNEVYRCFVYLKDDETRDLIKLDENDVETIKSINFGA